MEDKHTINTYNVNTKEVLFTGLNNLKEQKAYYFLYIVCKVSCSLIITMENWNRSRDIGRKTATLMEG